VIGPCRLLALVSALAAAEPRHIVYGTMNSSLLALLLVFALFLQRARCNDGDSGSDQVDFEKLLKQLQDHLERQEKPPVFEDQGSKEDTLNKAMSIAQAQTLVTDHLQKHEVVMFALSKCP